MFNGTNEMDLSSCGSTVPYHQISSAAPSKLVAQLEIFGFLLKTNFAITKKLELFSSTTNTELLRLAIKPLKLTPRN